MKVLFSLAGADPLHFEVFLVQNMASFGAVTKTLLKRSGGLNKSVAPNNRVGEKI